MRRRINRKPPAGKLLCFDLETAGLEANRAHIICAAAKWVGKKEVFTWRIDETPRYGSTPRSFVDDSEIVRGLIPLVEEADAVLAYYGSGFDLPFLNTRALAGGLSPPVPCTVLDPWKTARGRLKLARNSMDAVASLLKTPHQKQHIPWEQWEVARYGDKKAIDKLLAYNVQDVRVLEDIYFALRPIIANHPYLGERSTPDARHVGGRCPSCGSKRSKPHDSRSTRCFAVYRNRCLDCGTAYETHRKKIAA